MSEGACWSYATQCGTFVTRIRLESGAIGGTRGGSGPTGYRHFGAALRWRGRPVWAPIGAARMRGGWVGPVLRSGSSEGQTQVVVAAPQRASDQCEKTMWTGT